MDQRLGERVASEASCCCPNNVCQEYKDTVFDLIDDQNKSYYVTDDDILLEQGKRCGWTIYGVCDQEGVPDKPLTPFLAISLICEKHQAYGIFIEMPEPNCTDEEFFEPEYHKYD